jgi:hypothetical protein
LDPAPRSKDGGSASPVACMGDPVISGSM